MLFQERVAKMRKEDKVVVSPSSNHVGIDPSTTTISSNNSKSSLLIPPLLAPPPSSNIHSQQRRSRSRSRRPLSPTTVSAAITTNAKTGKATIVTPESSPVQTSRPIMARKPQQVPLPSPQQQIDYRASYHDHSNSNDLDWPVPSVSSSSPSLEDQQTAATPSSSASQRRQRYRRHTPPNNNESMDSKASVIPESYVLLIQKAFGHDTHDLYRDVLQVDRFTASAKDIRIAYFRRGRQVLASNTSEAESERNKLQFQAVSMAYEILTNPIWKRYYDEHGLTTQQHLPHQMMMSTCKQSNSSMHSSSTSYASLSEESVLLESLQQQLTTVHADSATPKKSNRATSSDTSRSGYSSDSGTYGHSGSTPPDKKKSKKHKQKRSSSTSQRRRSRSVGVRWHDYVEELVFEKEKENKEAARVERRRQAKLAKSLEFAADDIDNDDQEDEDDMLPGRKSKDKKKRKKHRVLVEAGDDEEDLSNHLSKLNRETGTLVVGFFDQLEAGLDHLMNLDGDGANMELDDFDKMLLAKQKIAYRRRMPSMDEDDDDKIGTDADATKAPQSEPSLASVPTSVRRRSFSSFMPSSSSSGKPTDETTQDAAAATVGGGNLVTDLFQQMTSSFDDFLLLERTTTTEGIKHVGTGNEKLRATQATSTSQHTNTKREGNNKNAWGQSSGPSQSQSQHNAADECNNDEVMTGPLMERLHPTIPRALSPDPVPATIPASSKNGRKRSTSRHAQARLMATASSPTHSADRTNTEELVTGPVAEWGRETDDHGDIQTSQSSPHLVALDPQDQQRYQNDFVSPPHPAPSNDQLQQQTKTPAVELYSLDDGSSVPAPPVQEVRKPQRSSRYSSQYRDQHHDDDMSSLSESFAAYIWSDPTPSCWTMHPPMTDDTSFKLLTVAAPAMDGTPATTSSVTPSSPRTALPSILKTPKFQPTSPQLPVQLDSDGYNPSNMFNDLDDYDDDPSSRGGGYSTPSNSIVSGSDMQSSNSHNIDFFPNIRITIHDDNDYCFAGCNNSHYEDARLGGQAFLRSLTKYMKEMSHDLAAACSGGTTPRDGSVDGNAVGCPQNAKALMQSLMISDEDLEGMLNVLRCEMDRHQVVPKHRAPQGA